RTRQSLSTSFQPTARASATLSPTVRRGSGSNARSISAEQRSVYLETTCFSNAADGRCGPRIKLSPKRSSSALTERREQSGPQIGPSTPVGVSQTHGHLELLRTSDVGRRGRAEGPPPLHLLSNSLHGP